MSKRIDAYFTSENDATSAESGLQRFRVSNTFVDTLPEPDEKQTYLPIYALGSASGGTGTTGAGSAGLGAFGWISKDVPDESEGILEKNDQPMTHMLEVELADGVDMKDIVDVLKENNGYMLKKIDD